MKRIHTHCLELQTKMLNSHKTCFCLFKRSVKSLLSRQICQNKVSVTKQAYLNKLEVCLQTSGAKVKPNFSFLHILTDGSWNHGQKAVISLCDVLEKSTMLLKCNRPNVFSYISSLVNKCCVFNWDYICQHFTVVQILPVIG